MNKLKIALIVGIVAMTTGSLRADTTLFGSIEQGLKVTDNGTSEIVGSGTIIGAKYNSSSDVGVPEDGSSNTFVFGELSADIDVSGPNPVTTRDAFVGVGLGGNKVKLSVGRMQNIQDSISEATIGIFSEGSDLTSRNAGRNSNTVKASIALGGARLVGTSVIDGSDGVKGIDSWETGASYSLMGLNLVSAYAKDENTGTRTILGGINHTFGENFMIGGIYEQDKTVADNTTDTLTAVTSYTLGKNVLKGGYQTVEDAADTYLAELEHNFNKSTSAFVNARHIDDTQDTQAYTVGFRLNF